MRKFNNRGPVKTNIFIATFIGVLAGVYVWKPIFEKYAFNKQSAGEPKNVSEVKATD